jgi:hypothetical protein
MILMSNYCAKSSIPLCTWGVISTNKLWKCIPVASVLHLLCYSAVVYGAPPHLRFLLGAVDLYTKVGELYIGGGSSVCNK